MYKSGISNTYGSMEQLTAIDYLEVSLASVTDHLEFSHFKTDITMTRHPIHNEQIMAYFMHVQTIVSPYQPCQQRIWKISVKLVNLQ